MKIITAGFKLLSVFGALLTVACTERSWQQPVADRIAQIDIARLQEHIGILTQHGPRSPGNSMAVQHSVAYIKSRLKEYGYQPLEEVLVADTTTSSREIPFVNIIAEHRGSGTPSRILELGAHYDTVDTSPGADDNASGVAAMLEIARIIAPLETERTIRFCFFALEENGRDGSYFHVRQLHEKQEVLDGAIIFEMIGYATDAPDSQATPARIPLLFSPPATGNFVAVIGNLHSGSLGNQFENAADSYVPELPYFSANRLGGFFRDALRSDHKPYWDHSYRAIMLTDTADFRNPHYHKSSDTGNTLNYTFLQQVASATAATLLDAAQVINPPDN